MTTRSGRTQPCDRVQARTRLDNAEKSLEVAELVAAEREIPESRSVAAALAVLSGIASADAACCAALVWAEVSGQIRDKVRIPQNFPTIPQNFPTSVSGSTKG